MKSTPKKSVGKRVGKRYGDGRAAFLGLVESIQRWIDEGRTLRSFFDQAGDLGITYSQFARHAGTYIRRPNHHRRTTSERVAQTGQGRPSDQSIGKPRVGIPSASRTHAVDDDDGKLI